MGLSSDLRYLNLKGRFIYLNVPIQDHVEPTQTLLLILYTKLKGL